MVLCVTIGGVYAAWTYTNPAADITDQRIEQLITISTATEQGAAGTYAIETNVTGMSIEQLGTNDQDKDFHTAALEYTTNDDAAPYVKFTLKLQENTGSDIFNTLTSKYSIEVVDVASAYDNPNDNPDEGPKDIFVDIKTGETVITWEYDSVNDIYHFTVQLENEIALNDFVLASKPEHTAFTTALGRPVLEVKITDGTTPQG
ncbi:MAG: hypothetical protein IKW33_02505 [Clostridia bacterium]|nr:hypothetical protein [Clostridia bacterium]